MASRRAIEAGLLYCAVVFSAGFCLGAVRVLWIEPLAGELAAVALEAPVMLAIAWRTCGWVTERLDVPDKLFDRIAMGAVALVVLLVAEAAIALFAIRLSLPQYFASYGHSAMLLGLLAQLAFALFPLIRRPQA